jgi:hypothetical protein
MTQRRIAGAGAIAFGALTLAANFLVASPGGGYSRAVVDDYLAPGHRAAALAALLLGLIGVVGLVCLLAELRGDGLAGRVVWGTGLAGAASFGVGYAVTAGQVVAHWEGGSAVATAPGLTYVIAEIGVVMIFGSGAMLVGLALLVRVAAGELGRWRWPTLVAGLCGIAGLAFFPFFLLLLWAIALGVSMLRPAAVSRPVAQARA